MADKPKLKVTGGGGSVPPPDAPIESAQPLTAQAIQTQQANARQNEKTLPPFAPKGIARPVPAAAPVVSAAPSPEALAADFFGNDAPAQSAAAPELPMNPVRMMPEPDPIPDVDQTLTVPEDVPDELPPLSAEDRARMPAASNSESPARGILQDLTPPSGDKFEGIDRGGFGDGGDGQYFPLSGDELLALVDALATTLVRECQNDLRFSLALTYPRVAVSLKLVVQGHVEDSHDPVVVEKIKRPKEGQPGSTPLEVADGLADRIVFVVEQSRREQSPDGESEHPPDAIRDQLGRPKPRHVMGDNFDTGIAPDIRAVTR